MHTLNFTLFVAAIAASGTLAHTQDYFQVPWHQWHAPRATDVRHLAQDSTHSRTMDIFPDGKHITVPMMLKAATDGFNFKADALMVTIAKFGLLRAAIPQPELGRP
ncbi:hypothetical protein B0H13DRAFT_763595 [Mycena leptocephala]|nr:hypothetical protein B0H13DRAFT_763595 [Mycena leptocephala]